MWQAVGLAILLQGVCPTIWIDKTHDDFQAGREFFPVQTASIRDCGGSDMRTWELGAGWWSPHDGGLKILGQEWDLDHNGSKDVVLCDNYDDVKVYWNNGNGFDPVPTDLSVAPYQAPQAIHLADLNNDGFTDILIGTGCYSQTSYIFYGTSNRNVWRKDSVETQFNTYGAQDIVPIDLNHDGHLDLVITGTDELWVLHGPNLSYRAPDRVVQVPDAGYICRTKFADVNNDGFLDIVTGAEGPVSIIFGPDFTQVQHLEAGEAWDMSIADLNRDGWLDLAADGSYGGNKVFWGSSNGFSQERSLTLPGEYEGDCAVADFNNDGVLDLAMGEINGFHMGESYVFFGPRYASNIETLSGGSVTAADYNNDGYVDLLMHWFVPQPLLFWNQGGRFDPNKYTSFPCIGDDGVVDELGAVWDRSNKARFLSRVIDIIPDGQAQPGNQNSDCGFAVGVFGNLPRGMELGIEVRSSLTGRRWSRWYRPVGDIPDGAIAGGLLTTVGRYYQYRLVAGMDYQSTARFEVDSVKAFFGTGADRTGRTANMKLCAALKVQGDRVFVTLPGSGRLVICDVTGREVRNLELASGSYELPLMSAKGVYILKLVSGNSAEVRKVVVSH